MSVRARLIGAEQAIKALDNLDKKVRNRINRKAVRAGGAVFLDGLRTNAPKRNGYFKRSLTQSIKTYRKNGTVVSIIGQNKKYTKTARKATKRTMEGGISGQGFAVPIHLVEWNTKRHKIIAVAKALRLAMSHWRGERAGSRVFVNSVEHPGSRGTNFVSKTEVSTRRAVEAAVTQKIRAELATP